MDKLGERSGDVTGVGLGEGVLVAGCIKTLVFVDVKRLVGVRYCVLSLSNIHQRDLRCDLGRRFR